MIAVIGLGFVGLTTGLGLAHRIGCTLFAYDCDPKKRELYRAGRIPFHEPELQEHLGRYLGNRFVVCDTLEEALRSAEYIFYCVGTPALADGGADLNALLGGLKASREVLSDGRFRVLVIKSTVPPGTTSRVIAPLLEQLGLRPGEHVGLAANPEFLREGSAWRDVMEPDRIVIGEAEPDGGRRLAELYALGFDAPVRRVSATTAEFVKYMSNSLLATMISFANEMAMIAEQTGDIEIPQAFRLLHEDKRWHGTPAKMTDYVYPGCGFGGYCLPKDIASMIHHASVIGEHAGLLQAAVDVNQKAQMRMAERIAAAAGDQKSRKIGILGLSFKPGSDDVRGAVSFEIIRLLLGMGYLNIAAYDPLSMNAFDLAYGLPISYAQTMEELASGSEVIALITSWEEFIEKRHLLSGKLVIDGRYTEAQSGVIVHAGE
ncbi:UDPglucose 6-dehydrogenase [Paenibacillus algorifonticola]|uniref:UDP-glucose 6-dehydrogenase n=1 Tax=Paenibacillus algorifonticola TaxID=684063 RepID=A0A1I2IBB7_9BACL|nr:nucleotide sugar dehydrogenase [Paenibacillus algorifonticola]SFF39659.1 UDPglucose 6-dehydrogenase [Paenibacillus algorifonticola]